MAEEKQGNRSRVLHRACGHLIGLNGNPHFCSVVRSNCAVFGGSSLVCTFRCCGSRVCSRLFSFHCAALSDDSVVFYAAAVAEEAASEAAVWPHDDSVLPPLQCSAPIRPLSAPSLSIPDTHWVWAAAMFLPLCSQSQPPGRFP